MRRIMVAVLLGLLGFLGLGHAWAGDAEPYRYFVPTVTVPYSPESGDVTIVLGVSIGEEPPLVGPGFTQGFSMGLAHSSSVIQATAVDHVGQLSALSDGAGPSFFSANLLPDGWTLGVVYSFLGGVFIEFDVPTEVVEVTFETQGALAGDEDGETVDLNWSNFLGSPPVSNVVVVNGASLPAAFSDGAIIFTVFAPPLFVRGDCNIDGGVDIADGIFVLNALFQGGPVGSCDDACDANDDGNSFDISDALYVINYQLLGGPAPAAPFPTCGTSVVPACDSYDACD